MTEGVPPTESAGRKWWLIPVGCLGAVVLCCGIPLAILPIVFGALKSSAPYQESLAIVKEDPTVLKNLGEPIEPSFFVTGNISVGDQGGQAAMSYDISGPKGSGTVVFDANKAGGEWRFTLLEVRVAGVGQPTIFLVREPDESPPQIDENAVDSETADE